LTCCATGAGGIGFVQQAATLQVGERGTVGSAAAAVGVEASAGILARHNITFDRPYLLLVSAKSTGEPLFLAEVANPAGSLPSHPTASSSLNA